MGKHGNLKDVASRQTQKSGEAQEQVEKAAEEDTKRLNANVPESLHQAVRMEAARRGIEMKQVMVEALTEYLPNYPNEQLHISEGYSIVKATIESQPIRLTPLPLVTPSEFVERWRPSGASQRSNYQLFLSQLCDLLGVGHPDPAGSGTKLNDYVFECRVDYPDQSDRDRGYIDLYKQGCLVLESKQDSDEPVPTEADRRPKRLRRKAVLELEIDISAEGEVAEPLPWPSEMKERAQALQQIMSQTDRPLTVEEVAQHFHRERRDDVRGLLETLEVLGIVETTEGGEYAT